METLKGCRVHSWRLLTWYLLLLASGHNIFIKIFNIYLKMIHKTWNSTTQAKFAHISANKATESNTEMTITLKNFCTLKKNMEITLKNIYEGNHIANLGTSAWNIFICCSGHWNHTEKFSALLFSFVQRIFSVKMDFHYYFQCHNFIVIIKKIIDFSNSELSARTCMGSSSDM